MYFNLILGIWAILVSGITILFSVVVKGHFRSMAVKVLKHCKLDNLKTLLGLSSYVAFGTNLVSTTMPKIIEVLLYPQRKTIFLQNVAF